MQLSTKQIYRDDIYKALLWKYKFSVTRRGTNLHFIIDQGQFLFLKTFKPHLV